MQKPTTPIFPDATLVGMFGKPVQTSAAIGIEMRDRSLRGVLLVADDVRCHRIGSRFPVVRCDDRFPGQRQQIHTRPAEHRCVALAV